MELSICVGLRPSQADFERYVQMNGDPPRAQVGYAQYATNYIPSQVVEHQHFPDGFSVSVQYRCRFSRQSVCDRGIVLAIIAMLRSLVQVEDFLNRCCYHQNTFDYCRVVAHTHLPIPECLVVVARHASSSGCFSAR